jgi:hypothetical protein
MAKEKTSKKKEKELVSEQTPPVVEQPTPPSEEELSVLQSGGVESPVVDPPSPVPAKKEYISVDKLLLFKIFKTCVQGYGSQLNKHAAVSKFGACLGGTNQVENKALWDEVQRYLETHK